MWEKPGRGEPVRMDKTFTVVPRGVGLVIGCHTFPTWNSWPGLFASLVCGNPVVVKPHPGAVLPLAITVQVAREVLAEAGFDADLVTLAAEAEGDRMAADLAVRPEVRLVDFTGSSAFGDWLEQHATQAVVFAEKAGVNTVVIDSTDDFAGMCGNLAFSFALYTGQMCTAPQNLFVPEAGIETDQGHKSYDEVAAGIGAALDRLLGDDAKAVELLGAVVDDGVLARLESAQRRDRVLVASRTITHPAWPDARVRTPLLVGLSVDDEDVYATECFGPVAYLIATPSTGGVAGDVRAYRAGARRDDRLGLLDRRRGARRRPVGRARRRRGAVGEPHRPGLRQPVGGVQRLPRHRCQPGRHGVVHRRRLRRPPVPYRPVPPPRLTCHRHTAFDGRSGR